MAQTKQGGLPLGEQSQADCLSQRHSQRSRCLRLSEACCRILMNQLTGRCQRKQSKPHRWNWRPPASNRREARCCSIRIISADVPSDGAPHTIAIARDDLPCAFDYVTAPVIDPVAHLRATITNRTERVLLPGRAHIFHGDAYLGVTAIEKIAPNEEFKLFVGIDDNIRVKRDLEEKDVGKGTVSANQPAAHHLHVPHEGAQLPAHARAHHPARPAARGPARAHQGAPAGDAPPTGRAHQAGRVEVGVHACRPSKSASSMCASASNIPATSTSPACPETSLATTREDVSFSIHP